MSPVAAPRAGVGAWGGACCNKVERLRAEVAEQYYADKLRKVRTGTEHDE